jgi:WD40-like Beta Propeller Repeat
MTLLLTALAAVQITLSPAQPVAEIDISKLKGELARLAWSDDGSEFYIQTIERDRNGSPKAAHHCLVAIAAKSVKDVDQEPAWAAKYWQWKSAQASPAAGAFKITVDERTETKRAASAPTGGDLARGGTADPASGSTLSDVAHAADTSQTLHIFALKVRNETIGEWVNAAVSPGTNFSWAPAPLQLLAFARREGGPIIVLDATGSKRELTGTKSALLPAWSPDGKRLAWIERKGKKYQLTMSEVTVP